MSQCLRITFQLKTEKDFLQSIILPKARQLEIEGTAQSQDDRITMSICGSKEAIENLVDILHKYVAKKDIDSLMIEPFLKVKDYRGIFRVIE